MNNNTNTELIKGEKRAYMKEWRKNNKERVKIHNARYWLKKAQANNRKEDIKDDNK